MLRVSDNPPDGDKSASCLSIDKKKRQVTLSEPTTTQNAASSGADRGPMVLAPKMFAFDALHTNEDSQVID
jgi:kinesin family protein 26